MQVVEYNHYGGPEVLHLAERPEPTPGPREIVIRNFYTTVNFGDLLGRRFGKVSADRFTMPVVLWLLARLDFGFFRPRKKILGSEFAGKVINIGEEVSRFKIGDTVFGYLGQKMGAYAEMLKMRETATVAPVPPTINMKEAASLPYGLVMAFSLAEKAALRPGQRVLIIGAGGSLGAAFLQYAKLAGCQVTALCGKNSRDYVKNLGADRIVDYRQTDLTREAEKYDLIFNVLGKGSFEQYRPILKPKGVYLLASFKMRELGQMLLSRFRSGPKVKCVLGSDNQENLRKISGMLREGKLRTTYDRIFSASEAAAAHRYAESGLRKAPVLISFNGNI
ncbi:MAG: NAD(P)-dependent alcohol dehydrogenase [Calditrichia bacterium]